MQALWMLLASLMFAAMGACIKMAAQHDASMAQIVLFRGIPSVLLILIWARSARYVLRPPAWKPHLIRNIAGVTSMWLGFYALAHLPLATATTLNYTAPLFIAGWMLGWGGVQMDRTRLSAVALGFMGVLAVLRPALTEDQWVPAAMGLAGGALGAVAYMQVRALGQSGEPAWRTVLIFSVVVTLTGALSLFAQPWSNPSLEAWGLLLLLGACGMLGQLAMTRAFGLGSPLLSAALQYTTILFSTVIGYLLWGDRLDVIAFIGMGLIVLAGLLSIWRTALEERQGRMRSRA